MSAAAAMLADAGAEPESAAPSLVVERLTTSIRIDRQWFDAVRDVSFEVASARDARARRRVRLRQEPDRALDHGAAARGRRARLEPARSRSTAPT